MEPLFRVRQAQAQLGLSPKVVALLEKRVSFVEEGVKRVEKVSGIAYPPHYVEPVLSVATSSVEVGQIGVLFARTIPIEKEGRLEIWVQISAPLVAFASKWTIHAVIAHEFMHYVELVRRFTRMETTSDEVTTTLFEAQYADKEVLYDPSKILADKTLIRLVEKRFPNGLKDDKLHSKTLSQWLEKGLPAAKLPPESNRARISITAIVNASFDPALIARLKEFEQSSVAKS
ncbi:MAG: hypothetical protein HYU39_07940 [Thaumarchaeota archaeon]|nr:hypothetical protein [Nitrososphaerota archaeon]